MIVGKKKNILLTGLSSEFIGECYEVFGNKFRSPKEKKTNYHRILWKNEEIEYLKKNYLKEEINKIASKINKSNYQINVMLGKLKLITAGKWTDEEIEFFEKNIGKSTIWLATQLNRSVASIKAKKRKYRLSDCTNKKL